MSQVQNATRGELIELAETKRREAVLFLEKAQVELRSCRHRIDDLDVILQMLLLEEKTKDTVPCER